MEHAAKISRIHDLEILVDEVMVHTPSMHNVLKFARILSAMAVEVRYPGMNADEDDAVEALHSADEIRNASRSILIEKNDTET